MNKEYDDLIEEYIKVFNDPFLHPVLKRYMLDDISKDAEVEREKIKLEQNKENLK